jgi:exonuclease III
LDHATSSGSNKFGYKCISSPGTIRSCGVAILYNPSYNVVSCSRDQDGRLLCVEFSKDGNLIQLVNIYAPNSAKSASAFFESLYQVLDPDTPTVLCGDFNTVVDPIKDRLGCNSQSRSAYNRSATLHHLMSTYDLHDAWRKIHPNAQEYSWHRPNGSQASRLDGFWLSALFLSYVMRVDILPFFRSGHSTVYMELYRPSTTHRRHGVSKLDTRHISDASFVKLGWILVIL